MSDRIDLTLLDNPQIDSINTIFDRSDHKVIINGNSNEISLNGEWKFKFFNEFREESLSNKLVTGRQNPVGVLGVLNRHYQWNMPGVSRESANKQALTASELPQLGQTQQNTSSLAVLEHGAGETEQNE